MYVAFFFSVLPIEKLLFWPVPAVGCLVIFIFTSFFHSAPMVFPLTLKIFPPAMELIG